MAALPDLAVTADLTALGIPTTNTALVGSLLTSVSAAVREAAGVPISLTTSTVTMWTEPSRRIELPARPVVSVDEVLLDGEPVTDYVLRGSSLYRDRPWQRPGAIPSELEVTFTHGYTKVPADIVKLVCTLVGAGIVESADGVGRTRGLSSESIDDYRVSYTRGEDEVVDATELPERTKAALRARFGGSAVTVLGTTS